MQRANHFQARGKHYVARTWNKSLGDVGDWTGAGIVHGHVGRRGRAGWSAVVRGERCAWHQPVAAEGDGVARHRYLCHRDGPQVDDDVEGLYTLDFVTGDLQCFVINPRNGQFGGSVQGERRQCGSPWKKARSQTISSRPEPSMWPAAMAVSGLLTACAMWSMPTRANVPPSPSRGPKRQPPRAFPVHAHVRRPPMEGPQCGAIAAIPCLTRAYLAGAQKIIVNGKPRDIPRLATIAELLDQLALPAGAWRLKSTCRLFPASGMPSTSWPTAIVWKLSHSSAAAHLVE